MKNNKAYLGLAVFMLIIGSCLVPSVMSANSSITSDQTNPITPFADPEPTNTSVILLAPIHNATIDDDFNVSFTFEPQINGTGNTLYGATLVVDGNVVESNQTEVIPYQNNTIYHKFSANGTYTWNIRLENNTDIIWAPEDFNLTIAIPEKDTGIAVELVSPDNDSTVTSSFNVSFVYTPSINGTDNKFYKASLVVNGSVVASNQTAITADTDNTLYYEFDENGTYTWNVRLQNETTTVLASEYYNFTLTVHTSPTATATPTPTPTPAPTTTATPTPKPATATPSPTPGPEVGLDVWTLIIVAVIVFSVVLIVTIFILKRRVR